MNKLLVLLNCFFFLNLAGEQLKFEIHGDAAILMNAETGAILFEQNATKELYPASTTKVATALYVLKEGKALDTMVTAQQDALATVDQKAKKKANFSPPFSYWLEPDGTHIGIKNGEILSLHDLLKGLLIASANDAANVIAETLGPSIPTFMERLNDYIKELGCHQTHFCNPHGLHDLHHRTTAYDLALITKEALKYPVFCAIISQSRFLRPKTNKQAATTYLQGNRLLRQGKYYYAKAIGVKTGYHSNAKKTFIGAAQSDGRTLIAVLLGYQDRGLIFEDAIKLFETAFNQPKIRHYYLKEGHQKFAMNIPKGDRPLETYLPEALSLDYYPSEDPCAKCFLYWSNLSLPIKKHQKVGEIHIVSSEESVLKKISLLAHEDIKFAWPYSWLNTTHYNWMFVAAASLSITLIYVLYRYFFTSKKNINLRNL